ncbi:ribosome small subunit-dependent GTPase A [Clostridium bornimense]|uniref:ribosome small subunit-dependent GTPase A n=1 Tax=Clostridium bornimense TaxID=1216932 RepID=UPI001C108E27|nr:ribosome small subunit-dependent GTPase A [Clostridium bornimense]MBU5316303.1 ribosome small subunit-dependent GTPase A [Clostridium bornimense]
MEGTIIKGIGGFYYVDIDGEVIECKARGKFRNAKVSPIVGDRVKITLENGKGAIEEIKERSNMLIRPLVANVTQAFVVFAIKKPDLNMDLLNKFLLLCEYNHIEAVVVFNKCDLITEEEKEYYSELLEKAHYNVIFVEGKSGKNLDKLKELMKDNITVFCGPSGVGKSTISNKLVGRELMETGEISEKLKRGKHTTRHSELIESDHGFLVDTPGFSNLDLSFLKEEEVKDYIRDFHDFEGRCKFTSCAHVSEPKCAVKDAVEEGKISRERYEFYLDVLEEAKNRRNKR